MGYKIKYSRKEKKENKKNKQDKKLLGLIPNFFIDAREVNDNDDYEIVLGPDDDDTPIDFDSLMPTICEEIESWPNIVIV